MTMASVPSPTAASGASRRAAVTSRSTPAASPAAATGPPGGGSVPSRRRARRSDPPNEPDDGRPARARRNTHAGSAQPPEGTPRPVAPTLEGLLATLGDPLLVVLTTRAARSVTVTEPVIHDPLEPVAHSPGSLLLAVGVRPSHSAAFEVIRQAAAAGAAAVVVKLHGESAGGLIEAAEEAGIALLAADDAVGWQQLAALLGSAAGSAGPGGRESVATVATGDLFALANAVAAMVGGAVTIEDPQQRVLAYSNLPDQPIDEARRVGILGRQVPQLSFVPDLYRTLWRAPGVIRFAGRDDVLPRIAVAVRAGSDLVGSIFVIDADERFGPEAESALADAARIAALHMLRARTESDLERRSRGELLRALLDARSSPELAAERLGLEASRPAVVLGFELPDLEEAPEVVLAERLTDLVLVHCEALRRRSSCVASGRVVYALLPLDPGTGRQRLVELAEAVVARAESALRVRVHAAVGGTAAVVGQVPRSRADVDQVLRVLARDPRRRRVAALEDVHGQTVLLEFEQLLAAKPQLRMAAVKAMLERDRDKDMPYVETVLAFLDSFGDTFRYRLRRVRELFGLDLDDPDERLVVWLQLRLLGGRP